MATETKKIKVAVGSTNRVKIDASHFAIMKAIEVIHSSSSSVASSSTVQEPSSASNSSPNTVPVVETHGYSTESGISDQPMTSEETRKGAMNRAINAAQSYYKLFDTYPDFAVGLEGGCEEDTWSLPVFSTTNEGHLDLSIATATQTTIKELTCFAWMVIYAPRTGRWGYARTGTFTLPPSVASLVRQGIELGTADDMVFKRTNSKQEDGAVGLLSRGLITRTSYYDHAMVLALIPFIRSEYYTVSNTSSNDKNNHNNDTNTKNE